jgi:hypothetical protein
MDPDQVPDTSKHKHRNIKYRIFIILQFLNKFLSVETDVSVPAPTETEVREKKSLVVLYRDFRRHILSYQIFELSFF